MTVRLASNTTHKFAILCLIFSVSSLLAHSLFKLWHVLVTAVFLLLLLIVLFTHLRIFSSTNLFSCSTSSTTFSDWPGGVIIKPHKEKLVAKPQIVSNDFKSSIFFPSDSNNSKCKITKPPKRCKMMTLWSNANPASQILAAWFKSPLNCR